MKTDEKKQEQQERNTGMALLLVLLLLIYFTENLNYILPGILLLVFIMTWPKIFAPVSSLWFGFSKITGEVVSSILLSVVFFGVALPIGLTRRLLKIDSMNLRQWKKNDDSCFVDKNHTMTAEDLKKPY